MRLLTEKQVIAAKKLIDVIAAGATTDKEADKVEAKHNRLTYMLEKAYEKLSDEFKLSWS